MPKLKAPTGADEANYGTERYRVDNDGMVDVAAEAVESLTKVGGFVEMTDIAAVPEGCARVRHPDGVGCSVNGVVYEAASDGSVTVPVWAVANLAAHGFAPAEDSETAE